MHPVVHGLVALPPHLKLLLVVPCGLFVLSCLSSLAVLGFAVFGYNLRRRNAVRRRILLRTIGIEEFDDEHKHVVVGFFHPYCNAGGGGERVLWTAIRALQQRDSKVVSIVYTGDAVTSSKQDMLERVKTRFGIELDERAVIFVPLVSRYLVEDSTWPRFTLLGQSIGSIFLALEGLRKGVIPDVWLDTMGYAFTYPFVSLLCKVQVGSYTHYPTISTDMLRRVQSRQAGHTNTSMVASSTLLSAVKLVYYILFAELYSVCLRRADVLMVNSTWTRVHIDHLLKPFGYRDDVEHEEEVSEPQRYANGHVETEAVSTGVSTLVQQSSSLRQRESTNPVATATATLSRFRKSRILYPPCDTTKLAQLPLEIRESLILSVAQFRPEKEHEVQLKAFKKLLDEEPRYREGPDKVNLILAGSVRNDQDEARVAKLRALAKEFSIEDNVSFAVNVSYPELVTLFGRASIGLHSMVDEHFGITVVEFQAAGLVPLVHASAGPLLDIVVPFKGKPTGFHATTVEEFADKMKGILELDKETLHDMRTRARRNAVERFSTDEFERGWLQAWADLKNRARM
ncbi:hypothetical protein ACM66B_005478 [Microbotryomycetes sp. NB124-2]